MTTALLEAFRRDPESFGGDLTSNEAIRWYYRRLYRDMESGFQDYTLKKSGIRYFPLWKEIQSFIHLIVSSMENTALWGIFRRYLCGSDPGDYLWIGVQPGNL